MDVSSGNTLVESVFFHTDRCYRASTEFGFSNYLNGLTAANQIYFYYEVNANCKPTGKCRVHGTSDTLVDQRINLPVAIPAGVNSLGGTDWMYEAYLVNGGSQWHVRVVYPYTLATKIAPINYDVSAFILDIARDYSADGANGYVTATSTRNGPIAYSGDPPRMNVVKIDVAK